MKLVNQTARVLLRHGLILTLPALASAQTFVKNTTDIPASGAANNSRTENLDFADVDLDGDWDALFGDGGDGGNDQNRIWINQGGLQAGTIGVFVDDTAVRLPSIMDQSRDVELADIDSDGDPDLHSSNTSSLVNQPNRWWINDGGVQGGTLGFYTDDTMARWVGLGAPGSSVANFAIFPSGGFIDWTCDSDFGDLDNDGDLDLVHSAYGGAYSGNVPTRLFLNDGAGYFSEFNPSGFQVPSFSMSNGYPGLWCDGTHQSNTSNTTGAFCDIATSATDFDLGDIDGDFDLDILLGSRDNQPRMFASRLDGSPLAPEVGGGALGFRDVSHASFPPNWATIGNYEQEFGDFDGDGDLDLYGLDWGSIFSDTTFENVGGGVFRNVTPVPATAADDEESDFIDYDNDGDLDVFLAGFSGQDKLYRNNWNGTPGGGGSFSFTDVTGAELPVLTATSKDGEICDVDGDGDYDIFVGNDFNQANEYLENVSQIPDTHAPYIPNVEQAPDRVAGVDPTVVRAHVYDNASYYTTYHNETWVEVTVTPGPTLVFPATSSGGQVFRAEIPGDLVGTVCYQFVSEDEYGNQGVSGTLCYEADNACPDPIGNYCVGAPNSAGSGSTIMANKVVVSLEANDLELWCQDLPDLQPTLAIAGPDQDFQAFFDGFICINLSGLQRFSEAQMASEEGDVHENVDLLTSAAGGLAVTIGRAYYFQYWYRDPLAGGTGANFSDAVGVCIVR